MAYSWQESVKPAGTQDIQCDIEYLDKSYIHVYLDGAETTAFTWTSTTNIRLNSPLSAETVVLLIRKTEREYLYIEFASGAPFIEINVDSQNKQFLHLAQELVEGRAIPGFYGNISMNGYRITNLEDPQDAQDAATKSYVDGLHDAAVARADAQFARALRVPESSVSLLPPAAGRSWTSLGFDGLGQPIVQDPSGTGLWGYVPVAGSFEQGSQLNQRFEVLLWESTGEYWRWDGVMPKAVLPGSTPATAGGTGKGKWIDVTDATLRSNLGSGDGFKWVGQADTLDAIRAIEPGVDKQSILVRRHNTATTVGGGEFYYDASDTTTEDNSCTVVVTAGGARWKRKNVGDEIHMEWAGARTAEYTDEAQDEAFENCLKAAAVGSPQGYPCRRIIAPMFGKTRLKEKHYCRGGVYPLSTGAGVVTESLNGKFGIDGHFIMEKGAGFYVVQTVAPEFNLVVDNESLTDESKKPSLGVTGGVDYILRLEGFNQNPKINIDAQSYGGNGLYVLGKGATSENAAHWPDLTDDYQGINNATGGRFNFRNCGRAFNLDNNLSGLGSLGAVWEQWSSGASTFNGVADLTFEHYETTVPYNAAKKQGSLIFNNCGQLRFGYLALGSGGKPLCAFNNCMSVEIDSYYAVHGESYGLTAEAFMTGMEVANTVVQISKAMLSGTNGIPFVIGKGGAVYLSSFFASSVSCIAVITNQAEYLTTFADSTTSPTWKSWGKLVVGSGETLYMNQSGKVLAARPSVLIQSDAQEETLVSIKNLRNLFAHNGFTGADERYYIRNESNFAEIYLDGCKLGDSTYPIYCRQPYNISAIKNCTIPGQIMFSSGQTSISGGGKFYKATGDQLTPSNPLSNTSKVRMDYFIAYNVASGGSIQVVKNGKTIYISSIVGRHPVYFSLMPGETATAAYDTATTTVSDYNTSYTYH